MQTVAMITAATASLFISELIVELIVSAVISSSLTPNLSASALLSCSLSDRFSSLVLKITSLEPATFCTCTALSPVTLPNTGTTLASIAARSISSLNVTLVDVPPTKSRL